MPFLLSTIFMINILNIWCLKIPPIVIVTLFFTLWTMALQCIHCSRSNVPDPFFRFYNMFLFSAEATDEVAWGWNRS